MALGTSLSNTRLRELAVEAEVDPRTIARALRGETVGKARAQAACERVLREHGLLPNPQSDVAQAKAEAKS